MIRLEYTSPPREDPSPGWGQSLADGAAGVALLHIEQARAGMGSWQTAHQWIAAAVRSPITARPDACSLYRGAPAVAFVLRAADHPAYTKALTNLDDHIAAVARHRLDQAHLRIDRGDAPKLREFDLISGLTGFGAYLFYARQPDGDDLLRAVLRYLVRLAEPLNLVGMRLPGWWSSEAPAGQPALRWPGGHGNLGMAHGIAGPLALLSLAVRRGIRVPGQVDAIERICAWLDRWRVCRGQRAWWPGMISMAEQHSGTVLQPGPGRPSWCYGTPGLARVQQLAAIALGDQQRQRQVEQALLSCITDDQQLDQLSDASLCHGWAGLVHSSWRAAVDAGSGQLAAELPRLRACMELQRRHHGASTPVGLLEGATGIRLVRHTTKTNCPPVIRWDTCLLLDG